MSRSARLSALSTFALAAITIAPLRAQADDAADAKALFEKGRILVKADNHADACPLFEQSLRLDPALGTELNLALCWAKVGRLVDAEQLFDHVLDKTSAPDQVQRHAIAEKGKADVARRMPKLQIDRGPLPADVSIRVDGEVVTADAIAVDPGKHTVTAEGATTRTIDAEEGQVAQVTLVLAAPLDVEQPLPEAPAPRKDRRYLYVGGAGLGVLVIGTVTGVMTLTRKSAGLDACDDATGTLVCTPSGSDKLDSARTLSHVTTGLFVVGAALVATGVVLKLRAPRPDQTQVSGWFSRGSGGLALGRAW